MLDIPDTVLGYARRLGLSDGNTAEFRQRFEEMVTQSAPITHPSGNRRYNDWIFLVNGDTVRRVHLIVCETCDDRKRVTVANICDNCDGDGCEECRDEGEFETMIPCPVCAVAS